MLSVMNALRILAAHILSASLLLPWAAAAADKLPTRNLLVEWRQTEESRQEGHQGGAVVLNSDGSSTRAGVVIGTGADRRQRGSSVHQLLVLNGEAAALRLTNSQPWQFVQAAWEGSAASAGTRGAVLGTRWVETGQGLQVRPRWSGGSADVVVELQAESAFALEPGDTAAPQGAETRRLVRTVLRLPMGQWVAVAESGEQQESDGRNVLSTTRARTRTRQVLQLRVSAP